MINPENYFLIHIAKRTFCSALFFFLFFFNLIGQENSVSDSIKNEILAKYNGFETTPVKPLLQAKFDSLLIELGIEKKISFATTKEPLFEYIWMVASNQNDYKVVTIPNKPPSFIFNKTDSNFNALNFLHAIGHHVNNDGVGNTIYIEEKELAANSFAGYFMNKMGYSKNTYTLYLKNDEKHIEPAIILNHINQNLLNSAFKDGWETYAIEQSLYVDENDLEIYKANKKNVDSLILIAEKKINTDYLVSANHYSKAYQYSNGKKISTLYNAYDQFLKAKELDKALLYANLLFKNGARFLDTKSYKQLFNDIAMIYEIKRDYENALKFLEIAHTLDITNTNLLDRKSLIISRQSNPEALINTLIERIKIGSVSTDLYYKLAGAYKANKQPLEAIKYYKRILTMSPKHINVRLELAKLYMEEGVDIINILNSTDLSKNPSLDIEKSIKTKKTLWDNAKNILKEGLKTNPKNPYLKQELKNLKTLKRTKPITLHYNF